MDPISIRSPIFVDDLAVALRKSKEEVTRVLVLDLEFLPITGLVDDDIAIELAQRFEQQLVPLETDQEELQRALDARRVEGDRMIEKMKKIKRGENPE